MSVWGRAASAVLGGVADGRKQREDADAKQQEREMAQFRQAQMLASMAEMGYGTGEAPSDPGTPILPGAGVDQAVGAATGGLGIPGIGMGHQDAQKKRYEQLVPGKQGIYRDTTQTPEAKARRAKAETEVARRAAERDRAAQIRRAMTGNPDARADLAASQPDLADNILFPKSDTGTSWQTIEGNDGKYHQINPKTGETRPVQGVAPRPQASQAGAMVDQRKIMRASQLRTQYEGNPVIKNASDMAQSIEGIRAAAARPSAANDMSLIFRFMKMQDPGSTVREGEYANAQNAAGVPERLRNAYNKAKDGQILDPNQRDDFVLSATQMAKAQRQVVKGLMVRYKQLAERQGLDPQDVVYDPFGLFDDGDAKSGLTINGKNFTVPR